MMKILIFQEVNLKFVVNCNVLYRVLYVESESVSQSVRVIQSVIFENTVGRSEELSEVSLYFSVRQGLDGGVCLSDRQGEGVKQPIQNRFVISKSATHFRCKKEMRGSNASPPST